MIYSKIEGGLNSFIRDQSLKCAQCRSWADRTEMSKKVQFTMNGIDEWDPAISTFFNFASYRDVLVSRRYTFDKLRGPSLGNLTTANLEPYDILVVVLPSINFTDSEIIDVMNWVRNGSGLFVLGD